MKPDAEIQQALERSLGARVTLWERRPSPYRTSFVLDELDVRFEDGRELALLIKELDRGALSAEALEVKPSLLFDPEREIEVYERLLSGAELGTAICYATGADPARNRYWLVLERVPGVELYQVGSRASWEHAARRLARLHERLAGRKSRAPRLLRYDAELLRRWPARAARFAASDSRAELERIAAGYDPVIRRILDLPAGVIHGEFYASNVLVDDAEAPRRVCPVDWEAAGVGPCLLDLAALVAGNWTDEDRDAIAEAYLDGLTIARYPRPAVFREGLDACRLQLAMQWLGWSPTWSPPSEHASDWLREALELSARLGV